MADTFVKKPMVVVGTKQQVDAEMGVNDFGIATDVSFYTAEETDAKLADKQDIATAVNYDNITNCITEIPQDIKLELANGVLTLKAGSKYYKPNGTYVVTTSDYNVPIAWNAAASGIIVIGNGSYACYAENRQLSGATNPTGLTGNSYLFWNTTENKMYWTTNGGSTWNAAPNCSVPIARVTWGADNKITSIDEIYNGFGYMGSTVFALPGIKGLIPNGRNDDGTLKNIEHTLNHVSIFSDTSTSNNTLLIHSDENRVTRITTSNLYYDTEQNQIVNLFNNSKLRAFPIATNTTQNGVISNWQSKTAFHAVDYSDTDFIAHQAMPSDKYIDLTLPASGGTITAPADGYLFLAKSSSAAEQRIRLSISNPYYAVTCWSNNTGQNLEVLLSVAKGRVVTIGYTAGGTTNGFRFIYANGAK